MTPAYREGPDALKRCNRCEEEKALRDFAQNGRRKDGSPAPDSYCRPCRRELARIQRVRARSSPERLARTRERQREWARSWRERNREASRASARRYYERLKQDPERYQAYLASQRISYVLRLERQGRSPAFRMKSAAGAYEEARSGSRLELAPLLKALPADWHGATKGQARKLYRLRHGSRRVSLALADELLTAVGKGYLLPTIYG